MAAAGVNLRYKVDQLPDELIDLILLPLDDSFSDNGFSIIERSVKRSLALDSGVVNVDLTQGAAGEGVITINFHLDSRITQH